MTGFLVATPVRLLRIRALCTTNRLPLGGGTGSGGTTTDPVLRAAPAGAQKALADGQDALKKGDWVAYGEAQKRLQTAIAKAVAAVPSGSVGVPDAQRHVDHGGAYAERDPLSG